MKSPLIMVVLQSICLVTPYSHLGASRYSKGTFLRASPTDYPSKFLDIPDISALEDDYIQRFTNVARLYENNVNITLLSLRNSHVCVVGLGGVGSWCVEALARSGVGKFSLIDMDDICISNTNRQIQALTSTVGQFKADALRNRILDINPYAQVEVILDFLRPNNVDSIVAGNIIQRSVPSTILKKESDDEVEMISTTATEINEAVEVDEQISDTVSDDTYEPYYLSGPPKFDFLVDAADGVTDKAFMIDACVRSGTPVVVCGGAGGLKDPTLLRISDMTKVVGDNLIMHVRKKLRQKFGYPQGVQMSATGKIKGNIKSGSKAPKKWNIPTIHTLPTGAKRGTPLGPAGEGNFRKCDVAFGNSCFSTGAVGFLMASVVVNSIAGGERSVPTPLGLIGRMRGPVPSKETGPKVPEALIGVTLGEQKAGGSVSVEGKGSAAAEEKDCNCGVPSKKVAKAQDVSWSDREAVIADVITAASNGDEGLLSSTLLVDSHCHLQLDPLYSRADETILTAQKNQIQFAVVCGTCPGDDWDRIRSLHERHPAFIAPQFGLHPWWISRHFESLQSVNNDAAAADMSADTTTSITTEKAVKIENIEEEKIEVESSWERELERVLTDLPGAGVGECGLDHCIKNVNMTTQMDILRRHIAIAARYNRSVTMHCVGAWGQLLEILKESEKVEKAEIKKRAAMKISGLGSESGSETGGEEVGGEVKRGVTAYILHSCNSLSVQIAAEYLKIPNVYFSFSGRALSATKEGKLIAKIPLERVLIETDSPDQLSLSLRNKLECNEPSLVRLNVEILATIMGIDSNLLASTASANSMRIFQR